VAAEDRLIRSPSVREQANLRQQILKSLPGSRPESAAALARTARLRRFRRDETIFRQGEEIQVVLLVSGHAVFRRTTIDGQQITVGIAHPGEVFGVTSVSESIASVEMVALNDVELASWSGEDVRRLAAVDPGLALDIADRLATILNNLTKKLDGYLHQDARRRVVRILARHRDLFFCDPPVLSRAHLPGLVGTSREMTGRVLRELENEGTVARTGRSGLRLLRPDQLDAGDPL
jgi:CRP/FNR family cyclic AMP-dependent transcriptional regulator